MNTFLILACTLFFFGQSLWAHTGSHTPSPSNTAHLVYKNKAVHLHTQFEEAPVVGTESILLIQARNGADHSVLDFNDTIEVELWMPAMGHGSAPTQIERVLDSNSNILPGLYKVRNIYFVMGGDWELKISVTDKNGNIETQSFKIALPEVSHQHN